MPVRIVPCPHHPDCTRFFGVAHLGSAGARVKAAMEALLVSLSTVFVAEMGDRTQLLSLVLATQYRKPWPIIAGIFVATLANHAAAGFGRRVVRQISNPSRAGCGRWREAMLAMAAWTLIPDKLDDGTATHGRGAFVATVVAFFIAEIGDKTCRSATVALAAGYSNLVAVIAGTTLGMMAANIPVVFLGNAFAAKLPMKAIHYAASALFAVLGLYFIAAAARHFYH